MAATTTAMKSTPSPVRLSPNSRLTEMSGTTNITRRQALAGLALTSTAVAGLPIVAAAAKKQYDLKPKKVADGLWMIEGATEYFTDKNGGAIVNDGALPDPAAYLTSFPYLNTPLPGADNVAAAP